MTKVLLHSKPDAFRPAAFPLLAIALLWHRIGALPVGYLGLLGVTRTSVTRYWYAGFLGVLRTSVTRN